MGYGPHSELPPDISWKLTEKIPVIVEMIDEPGKIDRFPEKRMPWMKGLPEGCLITCQETPILSIGPDGKK